TRVTVITETTLYGASSSSAHNLEPGLSSLTVVATQWIWPASVTSMGTDSMTFWLMVPKSVSVPIPDLDRRYLGLITRTSVFQLATSTAMASTTSASGTKATGLTLSMAIPYTRRTTRLARQ